MSKSCHSEPAESVHGSSDHRSCYSKSGHPDYLLLETLVVVAVFYFQYAFFKETTQFAQWYSILASSVHDLVNTVWWGVVIGVIMVAALSKIPREFVMCVLGKKDKMGGILRATVAGSITRFM